MKTRTYCRWSDRTATAAGRAASWRQLLPAFLSILLCLAPSPTIAEGFRNPPPGAFNLGRAGGRIAQVDDSSAVGQNPANLVDLVRPEVQLTPSIVYIKVDYKSLNGQTATTDEPWKLLPNLFAAAPLYDGKLAVGFGITVPYGLANEWNRKSSAFTDPTAWRYQSPYFAELKTVDFSPAIAIRLGDRLQAGAALDVMWSEITLKQFYPWFLATGNFSDPDGTLQANADGIGAGAHFGLTWQITEHQRLALTCRTPIRIDYLGEIKLDNVPPALGGGILHSDFRTSIKFPTILAAGYGISLSDAIRLEADVEWLQFSNFKTLPLRSPAAASLGLPPSIPQNWKDTFTAGIGGDWKFAPGWIARAGYQFYQSPVPDSTFSPTIPDANQNVFTIGLGYTYGHHSLEGAYGLDFYDDRVIRNDQNPAFNGTYTFTVHLFSVAYRYSF